MSKLIQLPITTIEISHQSNREFLQPTYIIKMSLTEIFDDKKTLELFKEQCIKEQ